MNPPPAGVHGAGPPTRAPARHVRVGRRRLLGLAAGAAAGGLGAAVWALWPGAEPGPAGVPAVLRVATGPPGAVYRKVGGSLVQVLSARFPHSQVSEIQTGASVDNLELLAGRETELAFSSLDSTAWGLAAGIPRDVTAVARIYDSWMQVFVAADSPIRSFAELDGRPIAAGAAGSGTRFTLERLIETIGIRPELRDATQEAGAEMLAAGQVAAMCTLTGVPTPAVAWLVERMRLRMLPLDGGYAKEILDEYGELYAAATLPSSVYQGVASATTLTTPNLLLARPDLSPELVMAVADALFAERARIAVGHPEALRLNVRTGIATGPVRLHPGAQRYFRAVKA